MRPFECVSATGHYHADASALIADQCHLTWVQYSIVGVKDPSAHSVQFIRIFHLDVHWNLGFSVRLLFG